MTVNHKSVVIVGGGSAGIAAGRRLTDAGLDCLILEARNRLGGRAWTLNKGTPFPVDLGCGWFHSADRNPWREIAEAQGRPIDKTPPPWMRPATQTGFPLPDQRAFREELGRFYERLH